jgi:phosphonate transport system permease protein
MAYGASTSLLSYQGQIDKIAQWRNRSRLIRYSIIFFISLLILWSVEAILIGDTDWSRMSMATTLKTAKKFLAIDYKIIPDLIVPAFETVLMATMATFLGLILAIPVAWLGAANISPLGKFTFYIGRFLMTLSRSVHEIVWGLIFVSVVGLGAMAGILAMAIRSIGFISKTIAEAIEDVNKGQIEAIKAVGGNRFQILIYAVVPQILPVLIANIIFEWDVNIRRSTIMGLVGAGGLGLALFRQMAAYNYGGIASVIVVILIIIAVGEVASYYARKAVI